jgi:hypothetical protein
LKKSIGVSIWLCQSILVRCQLNGRPATSGHASSARGFNLETFLVGQRDIGRGVAFRLNKVINEPNFPSLHVGRILAQAASLVRAQQGKLAARSPLPRRRSQKIRLGQ